MKNRFTKYIINRLRKENDLVEWDLKKTTEYIAAHKNVFKALKKDFGLSYFQLLRQSLLPRKRYLVLFTIMVALFFLFYTLDWYERTTLNPELSSRVAAVDSFYAKKISEKKIYYPLKSSIKFRNKECQVIPADDIVQPLILQSSVDYCGTEAFAFFRFKEFDDVNYSKWSAELKASTKTSIFQSYNFKALFSKMSLMNKIDTFYLCKTVYCLETVLVNPDEYKLLDAFLKSYQPEIKTHWRMSILKALKKGKIEPTIQIDDIKQERNILKLYQGNKRKATIKLNPTNIEPIKGTKVKILKYWKSRLKDVERTKREQSDESKDIQVVKQLEVDNPVIVKPEVERKEKDAINKSSTLEKVDQLKRTNEAPMDKSTEKSFTKAKKQDQLVADKTQYSSKETTAPIKIIEPEEIASNKKVASIPIINKITSPSQLEGVWSTQSGEKKYTFYRNGTGEFFSKGKSLSLNWSLKYNNKVLIVTRNNQDWRWQIVNANGTRLILKENQKGEQRTIYKVN